MYTNWNGKNNISDEDRAAFKEALTIYYSGNCTTTEAFAEVQPGLVDRYYRRKNKFPDEIEAIITEARGAAQKEVESQQLDINLRQVRFWLEMMEPLSEALLQAAKNLVRVINLDPWDIYDKKTGKWVPVPIRPRDVAEATRVLLDMGRNGLLPKGFVRPYSTQARQDDQSKLLTPLNLGINPNDIKTISAVRPDGKVITIHKSDPDTIHVSDNGDDDIAEPWEG